MDYSQVFSHFTALGNFVGAERYGDGHINETYRVTVKNAPVEHYLLQKINSRLFTDVPALMNNIRLVTEFVREKIRARGGNPARESLSIVPARDGLPYYYDGRDYWRIYEFIEGATTYSLVQNPRDFYAAAVAFGNFANLLAEFDAGALYDVLPDFHNTRVRFENLRRAAEADTHLRAASVAEELDFAYARRGLTGAIVDRLQSGEIPWRVTHNDTKLNNVMIDDRTGEPLAVIDLDTIMKGSLCYDFGDSIRFGCNPAAEDEPNLARVNFSLPLFRTYAQGYLSCLRESITPAELDNLATGAILMTYECGIRFLTDYLEGDVYFRTHRPGQNLDRARTQFKLVRDMEAALTAMNDIVRQAYRGD